MPPKAPPLVSNNKKQPVVGLILINHERHIQHTTHTIHTIHRFDIIKLLINIIYVYEVVYTIFVSREGIYSSRGKL